MAKEQVFGDGRFTFPTKKAAQEHIQAILNSQPLREPLVGDALEFIAALVARHPAAEEKVGCGIASIDVRRVEHGTRGFWITRTDGSVIDFSYLKALSGEHSHKTRVLDALRRGVREQVDEFRRGWFTTLEIKGEPPLCALTGQRLWLGPYAEVDHEDPTFAELAQRFVGALGSWEEIATVAASSGLGQELANPGLLRAWQGYHRSAAKLRVIHRSANRARVVRAGS